LKAVILAGGYGTRLRPLTYSRPKPMLPMGPKPVLQHVVESLVKQGFDEIIITANYLEEQITDHFGDGSQFGVSIKYPKEDKPLGTAGSVRNADQFLGETFAVIQGDNITDIDLAKQLDYHKKKNAMATLGVIEVEQPWRYGVVQMGGDDRIVGFQEKPSPQECISNQVSTGLYILEPDVLDLIPRDRQIDFAKDVFPAILKSGKPLYGYRAKGFWVDIGSVEGFLEASEWVLSRLPNSVSSAADISKATLRGKVWIGDDAILEEGVTVQGPVYIEGPCVIGRGTSLRSGTILKSGARIGESSDLEGASLFGSTKINSGVRLRKCILDERCEIGARVRIEEYAVLGVACRVGDGAFVGSGVKLDPESKVEREKIIKR
jgi:mannose-1-phosphate guanylyltransferase/phosphomannomutase